MAHNSDYSYIYATPPTVGLSLYEIMRCLGANTQDLGALCASPLVKPMAKYKPVCRNTLSALTLSDREAAHHGFSIPGIVATDRPYNLLTYYDGTMNGWQYDQPRGMSYEEWARVLDFNGYTNAPKNPLKSYATPPSVVYDSQTSSPFQAAGFMGLSDSSGLSIELVDFPAILSIPSGSLYFGVALFKGTGLTPTAAMDVMCEIATSGVPITKNTDGTYSGTTVSFSKAGMTGNHKGTWTIVPFLCNGAITQRGAWSGGTFLTKNYYPLPFANIAQMEVSSYQDSYVIYFEGHNTGTSLSATITITNNASAAFTKAITFYVWDSGVSGKPGERTALSYEKSFELHPSVAVGSSYDWSPFIGRVDDLLLQRGVAYIQVEGEGTIRGPFNFYRESPE